MVSGNHFLELNISRTHKRPFAGIYIYVHMKVMVYIYGIWKRCLFKWIFLKYARLYMKATDHYWEILPLQINIFKSFLRKVYMSVWGVLLGYIYEGDGSGYWDISLDFLTLVERNENSLSWNLFFMKWKTIFFFLWEFNNFFSWYTSEYYT